MIMMIAMIFDNDDNHDKMIIMMITTIIIWIWAHGHCRYGPFHFFVVVVGGADFEF